MRFTNPTVGVVDKVQPLDVPVMVAQQTSVDRLLLPRLQAVAPVSPSLPRPSFFFFIACFPMIAINTCILNNKKRLMGSHQLDGHTATTSRSWIMA
jgi:hypothetical protein